MNISFHGASREVTGSCYLVETDNSRFLVDCGMFQGSQFAEKQNYKKFSFDPKSVDFLLLTHAHFDHVGRLPKLRKEGFRGKIYATEPTKGFTQIVLKDAARIILEESRQDKHPPLYAESDVIGLMKQFNLINYGKKIKITPEVTVRYRDAGHILGSAIIEIWLTQGRKQTKVVFSGDLGNPPVPLLRDTEFIDGADTVIMESTYGGRIHEPVEMRHDMLQQIFTTTIKRNGVLMIPAFAIERTQELLYELNHLVENKEVPQVPVFVDSPMAIRVTNVYAKYKHLYDKKSRDLIATGDDLFQFPRLSRTLTTNQSKSINKIKGPKVIIAGSGMCTGGRILHHLKHYLPDKRNQLLIIGYQAQGTVGRQLREGAKKVKIHKQTVDVRAGVTAIGAYSAHADQPKLLHWVKQMRKPVPGKIYLTHGELKAAKMLQDGLKQKLNIKSVIPQYGRNYKL